MTAEPGRDNAVLEFKINTLSDCVKDLSVTVKEQYGVLHGLLDATAGATNRRLKPRHLQRTLSTYRRMQFGPRLDF